MPEVDPVKSEASITSGGHSGCAITSIPGFCFFISSISFALNCSWTIHVPFHDIIFTLVFFET